MPSRIQMTRQRPWRADHPDAVIVARGSDWGNPYRVGEFAQIQTPIKGSDNWYGYQPIITREIAVLLFRIWISDRPEGQIRHELAGKDLACWCRLDQACHGDVLLSIAAGGSDA